MSKSITVFVPIKRESRRLPGKNLLPFAGFDRGIAELKLRQLAKMKMANEIVVSVNSQELYELVLDIKVETKCNHMNPLYRPESLCLDTTKADDLISYAATITRGDHLMWVHATSPLVQADQYDAAVTSFLLFDDEYDSLLSGHWLKNFLLSQQVDGLIVNNPTKLSWPRTQDLTHYFEPNHAMFIRPRMDQLGGKRVGTKPYFYEMDKASSLDIDERDDFVLAEMVYLGLYGSRLVR